ncbi:Uncharacterised protein [Chryseobacterium carnipullorum]|uniref:Uncharacterized protein n=1 Tax=Chryseobacterium carnipullorum TaxID=1124835 RepID=A0A376DYE8_CHRCU|nr:Uncharacterised protein [Chryseobacterium carnipullorum]
MAGKLINSGKLERGSVNVSSLIKEPMLFKLERLRRDL